MKQLFSQFLVAFFITSAVVLSWSEYFLPSRFSKIDFTYNLSGRKIQNFPHCGKSAKIRQISVWKNEKFILTKKISRQINYLAILAIIKTLISRNLCQKSVRVNFHTFFGKKSRESNAFTK